MENRNRKKRIIMGIKVPRYMERVSNNENKIAFLRLVVLIMGKYKNFTIINLSTIRIKLIEIIKSKLFLFKPVIINEKHKHLNM
ncbi:MAG: hypothetical protein WBH31_08985 [Promethearchaeia archaeon]